MHRESTKVTVMSRWPLYKGDRYDRFDCIAESERKRTVTAALMFTSIAESERKRTVTAALMFTTSIAESERKRTVTAALMFTTSIAESERKRTVTAALMFTSIAESERKRTVTAALMFTKSIAESERKRTVSMLGRSFFSFMMDGYGSTDISGDEQEAIYIRFSQSRDNWKVSGNRNTKQYLFKRPRGICP